MKKRESSKIRHNRILQELSESGMVNVNDLSEFFNVSPITIRRDLDQLNKEGSLDRTHGGARVRGIISKETLFTRKEQDRFFEKSLIGRAAAQMIPKDATVFLNGGSTTLEILKNIKNKPVSVFTNNLAATAVPRDPLIDLFILGGEYREASKSLVGDMALLTLSQVYSTFTFLGANGVDPEEGITSFIQQETRINQLMISRCRGISVIVADHSKLGKVSNFLTASIKTINKIITDEKADPVLVKKIRNLGTDVYICRKDSVLES